VAHLTSISVAIASLSTFAMPAAVSAQDRDVVVTGRRPPNHEATRTMVQQMIRPVDGKLPRWQIPICPVATGLSEDANVTLALRMRQVAKNLGIRVAAPGCSANFLLAFAPDSLSYIKAFVSRLPSAFNEPKQSQKRALLEGKGPARVWVSTVLHSEDGVVAIANPSFNGAATIKVRRDTNIPVQNRQDIEFGIVVIDSSAAIGKSLNQLADYAMMRDLSAMASALGPYYANSITNIFEDGRDENPRELTSFDLSVLKALYRGGANVPVNSKVAELVREVERDSNK